MTHTDTLNTLSALRTALIERTEPTADLAEQSANGVELYARFGDEMASIQPC